MVRGCPGLITVVACAVLMTTAAGDASAADIRVEAGEAGSQPAVAIEGQITAGDFDTFIRLVKEHQGTLADVYLFSSGGDFTEAMKIGRAMRALELSSRVAARTATGRPSCSGSPGLEPADEANCTCASACFFIHVAATHRSGDYLAVHRPYFPVGAFGRLSQGDAMKTFDALQRLAAEYMDDMGVPQHIQDDILGTPSDRTLSERLAGGSTADARAAEQKPTEVRNLEARRGEELECVLALQHESRRAAYDKYFGRPWFR